MPIKDFTYLSPKTIEEALEMRTNYGTKSSIMAGGTDLLLKMQMGVVQPDFIIGLNGITNLDYINLKNNKELVIGALTKLSSIEENTLIKNHFPALAHSSRVTATVQIRNMGTLVGNICNASPSADNATPLLVYAAKIVIVNQKGERTVSLDNFFKGPGKSILEPAEIVKEIIIPKPEKYTGSNYQKISTRSKVDIAGVCVSALITLDDKNVISKARIALGAVAPIPFRVYKAEKMLQGKTPEVNLFKDASQIAMNECYPISDMRTSAEYRKAMVEVLVLRALKASLESATNRING